MPSKYQHSTKPRSKPTGRKAPPTGTDADLNLSSLSRLFTDETAAREWLESKRWPDGKPFCPHCGEQGAYKLESKPDSKYPVTPGTWKCKACRKKFTVRIGTIFEESHVPISKWLMAMHLMASSKKGVSSHQIARELDVTVKTAWFLTHRIRECMKVEPVAGMLKGVVEADETWVGGKPRRIAGQPKGSAPRKESTKVPVAVLVERDGQAVCQPIANTSTAELRKVAMALAPETVLMTDEWRAYRRIAKGLAGHHSVSHKGGIYAYPVDDGSGLIAHNNTAESFFALLKRGHYGIFHQLSKKHLARYCAEFAFRWNHRKVSDGHRMVAAVNGSEGKRLKYKGPSGDS